MSFFAHAVTPAGDLGADETQLGARLQAPNITWLTRKRQRGVVGVGVQGRHLAGHRGRALVQWCNADMPSMPAPRASDWGLTMDKVFSGWKKAHRPDKVRGPQQGHTVCTMPLRPCGLCLLCSAPVCEPCPLLPPPRGASQDVVIPVFLTPGHFKHFGLERTPLHPLMDKQERTTTFFFAGGRGGGAQGCPEYGMRSPKPPARAP